jgi:predicted RNA-binding Zn-ribbon protein involved in translation (DUF1610 family)
MKETYEIHIRYTNCGYASGTPSTMVEIPRGITIEEKLLDYRCPICGCKTIKKA